MALSIEQFLNQAISSELLTKEEVSSVISETPVDRRPKNGQELARELVKLKKLTRYQAEQIYVGKGKTLVLGNYVILDKLGQGGMGVVLKAEHKRLKRLVALKVMSAGLVKTPDALRRFHREVEAAARLRHPNVVATDDADEAKGTHFLVMEYVEGSDLSAFVKKNGPLSVNQAVHCILQAARGLEFAHAQGVVHRDIKPANLLLDSKGNVKILDMGLARVEGDSGSQGELTSTGAVMGTVDYMAPEQALSTKHADARSDIYSLGISLWYLLTGRCAYEGDTLMSKLLAHREAPIPSLCELDNDIPAAVDMVFRKMVAKQAKERYQTMTEVIRDLERFQSGASSSSSVVMPNNPEDSSLQSFLSNLGSPPSTAAAARTITAPAVQVKVNTAADVTMLNGNIGVETDPQTLTPIRARERQAKASRHPAATQVTAPPWYRDLRVLIGGGAAALLALFAVIILIQTPYGTLRVEILDPEVAMKVQGTELTFQSSDMEPVSLVAGDKKLIITRGDLSFETPSFSLKKGMETRVRVELIGEKIVVRDGETVIAEQPLRRSLVTASTTDTAPQGRANPMESDLSRQSTATTAGLQHTALEFNGLADVLVEIPSLRLRCGGPVTLEGYFTPAVDRITDVNQVLGFPFNAIWIQPESQCWQLVWQHGDGNLTVCPGIPFVKGRRTHIAGVVEDGEARLFVDGRKLATQPLMFDGEASKRELIGPSLGSNFPGLIDNVRISQVARYQDDFVPTDRLTSDAQTLACFEFMEGSGSELRDSSGNNHHGRIVGATWRPGLSNAETMDTRHTLEFDGQASRVELPMFPLEATGPVTIEAWFTAQPGDKPNANDVDARTDAIWSLQNPQSKAVANFILDRANDGWWFGAGVERLVRTVYYSFTRVDQRADLYGTRHHAAFVWDGDEVRLYVDGQPLRSGGTVVDADKTPLDPSIRFTEVEKFFLGAAVSRDGRSLTRFFHGGLDEFRISKSVRYATTFTPEPVFQNDPDTVALYHFDEGQGDVLTDSSGNNHHGKIIGAKWVKGDMSQADNVSAGWIDLFNGKDLTGWKVMGSGRWTAFDGVLTGATTTETGTGWLMSESEFTDFELNLEYKLDPGSNSGIFLRAWPEGDLSGSQFQEIQLLDDEAPAFASIPPDRRNGSLFGRIAPSKPSKAPANEWNRLKVRLTGQELQVTMNDVETIRQTQYSQRSSGRIGLQLYPNKVEFRNLRILPLGSIINGSRP